MKKIILSSMLTFILINLSLGQISNQITLGGDLQTRNANLLLAPSGGFYAITSTSASSFTGNINTNTYGMRSILLTKYDENFNIEWQKSYGGSNEESSNKIIDTGDGLLIIGSSNSPPSGNKTSPQYGNGSADCWVLKLDYNGDLIWQKTFGGSLSEILANGTSLDNSGNVILSMYSSSNISGNKTVNKIGIGDYWVLKIDGQGNIIWQKTFGGEGSEYTPSIASLNNGNILISGPSNSNQSGSKSEDNYGNQDYWVLCIDSLGNKLWDKTLGTEGAEGEGQIIPLENNHSIHFINSNSVLNNIGNRTAPIKGTTDIWSVELDPQGNIVNQNSIGGDSIEILWRNTIILPDGRFFLPVTSHSNISFDKSEDSRGERDYWPLLFSKEGNLIWEKTIGGDDWDQLTDILMLGDKIILAGHSRSSISGDKTVQNYSPFPQFDLWLLALDTTLLSTDNNDFVLPSISLFPNPTSSMLTIKHDVSSLEMVEVFNTKGQKIYEENSKSILSQSNIEIDLSGLSTGVYTVKITGEHFVMDRKVVKE